MNQAVILVHGLWMRGPDMLLLRYRLRRCGFVTYQFSYPTTRCTVDESAQLLQRFIARIPETTVHWVAHSLGGLVVQRLFTQQPAQRPGRVVTLGTPYQGSAAARGLARFRAGRFFLGNSFRHGLAEQSRQWTAAQPLGVIAGDLSIGGGRIFAGLTSANDGTVGIDEARIPGATEQRVVHVSHMGLLLSPQVARLTCTFLRSGTFGF
jgi:pimeloyl-ACP methyl ester carboxylesterase